jgi:hypothetical protein
MVARLEGADGLTIGAVADTRAHPAEEGALVPVFVERLIAAEHVRLVWLCLGQTHTSVIVFI